MVRLWSWYFDVLRITMSHGVSYAEEGETLGSRALAKTVQYSPIEGNEWEECSVEFLCI